MSPDIRIRGLLNYLTPRERLDQPKDKWLDVSNSSLGKFLNQLEKTALSQNIEASTPIPAPDVLRFMRKFSGRSQSRVYDFARRNNVLDLEKRKKDFKISYFFSFDQILAFGALCWGYGEGKKVNGEKQKWKEVINLTKASLGKNYLSEIIKDPQVLTAGVVFERDSKDKDAGEQKTYDYEGVRNYFLKDFLETIEPWISRSKDSISIEDLVKHTIETLKPDHPLIAEWELKDVTDQAFRAGILKSVHRALSKNDARLASGLFFFDKEVFAYKAASGGNLEKLAEITLRSLGDHPLARKLKDWQRGIKPLPVDGFLTANDLETVKEYTLADLDEFYNGFEDLKTVFVGSIPGFPNTLARLMLVIYAMDKKNCQNLWRVYEDLTFSGFKTLLGYCIKKILLIEENEEKESNLGELYKRSIKDFELNRID